MKRAAILVAISFVGASLLNRAYNTFGWHYFEMPYPDWIARIFHLSGEAHYNAAETEVLLEFFLIVLALSTGSTWAMKKFKYRISA